MIKTTEEIIQNLMLNFGQYSSCNTTGDIKRNTTVMVDNYVNSVLDKAIGNKNFSIKDQYPILIEGSFSKKLDKAVLDTKKSVKLHIEHKSYGDIDMLERFVADSHCILQHHPNIINVAICLQPATPLETFSLLCKQFSFVKYNKNLFLLTLSDENREYKKDKEYLYLHSESFWVDRTNSLIANISNLL